MNWFIHPQIVNVSKTMLDEYDGYCEHVKVGTRARVAELISELPEENKTAVGELYTFDPAQGNRKFLRNLDLIQKWNDRENGRITCMLGPQGPDMCSKELLLEIQEAAFRLDTGIITSTIMPDSSGI